MLPQWKRGIEYWKSIDYVLEPDELMIYVMERYGDEPVAIFPLCHSVAFIHENAEHILKEFS